MNPVSPLKFGAVYKESNLSPERIAELRADKTAIDFTAMGDFTNPHFQRRYGLPVTRTDEDYQRNVVDANLGVRLWATDEDAERLFEALGVSFESSKKGVQHHADSAYMFSEHGVISGTEDQFVPNPDHAGVVEVKRELAKKAE